MTALSRVDPGRGLRLADSQPDIAAAITSALYGGG
jgi:hypothetical protein